MKICTAFILLLTLAFGKLNAQTTNQPYSLVGIGSIETDNYNRTSGMGNTGIGYRNLNWAVNNNPASYTALQQQYFQFDVAGRGQFSNYYGGVLNGTSASNKDFAIKHVSVAAKIFKWWGTGGGLAPYSTANYQLDLQQNVGGTAVNLPSSIDGSGGVNQVYWANSFQPVKFLSLGVKTSYLFGSTTESQSITQSALNTALVTTQQTFYKNFYFTYGAQLYFPISKKWDLSFGGTFAPAHTLSSNNTISVTDNGTTIVPASPTKGKPDFTIADQFGAGFSITKDHKYTFVGDYIRQNWSGSNNLSLANVSLRNSDRISLGFEISNNVKNIAQIFEKSFVQGGIYYGDSYLQVNGTQLKEMGVTLGYGLFRGKPPLGTTIGVVVGLDVGVYGTTTNSNIRENYINFHVILSYRDFWHTKGTRFF